VRAFDDGRLVKRWWKGTAINPYPGLRRVP